MENRIEETKNWYIDYYKNNPFRNDLRSNAEVLFQILASEVSLVKAIRRIKDDPKNSLILDVGCGNGANVFQFLRLNYQIENITGIDINDERLSIAQKIYPNADFILEDASKMQFEDNTFDLVYESTMFSTLPDDSLCRAIADEMIRVCKVGGYILLIDWRIPKPNNPNYNALTKKKLTSFFKVGSATKFIAVEKGALVPPVGRFLSKNIPSIYFLISRIFPFLVGQVAYLLKKEN